MGFLDSSTDQFQIWTPDPGDWRADWTGTEAGFQRNANIVFFSARIAYTGTDWLTNCEVLDVPGVFCNHHITSYIGPFLTYGDSSGGVQMAFGEVYNPDPDPATTGVFRLDAPIDDNANVLTTVARYPGEMLVNINTSYLINDFPS